MNSAEPVYYKPSGKCPPQSFLMAAIVIFFSRPCDGRDLRDCDLLLPIDLH